MRFLHTMLRVRNLDAALDFYCNKLGLKEVRRRMDEKNRYTLVFLAAPEDEPRSAWAHRPVAAMRMAEASPGASTSSTAVTWSSAASGSPFHSARSAASPRDI